MQEPKPKPDALTTKSVALLFVLCAAADAAWGCLRGHSLTYVLGSVIVGAFGTAIMALVFFFPRDHNSNRDE